MVLLSLLIIFFVLFVLFKRPVAFRISRKSENVWCTVLLFQMWVEQVVKYGVLKRIEGKATATYVAAFYKDDHDWPEELVENMKVAASILKRYGHPKTLDTDRGRHLHNSFDYYCCYTEEEAVKIGKFLKSYSWTPHEVWFDKIECAIHGYGDVVSLVLMADKKSQQELTRWVLKNERDLEVATGLKKNIPRTQLQDFHKSKQFSSAVGG